MRVPDIALRGLSFLPRKAARDVLLHLNADCIASFDGIKLHCHPGDNVTDRVLLLEDKNRNGLLSDVRRITEHLPSGGTFVDIGANSGLFSLFAARKVGQTGRVIAIEPQPIMIDRLKTNIAANGFDNITIVETAIGPAAGDAILYVRRRNYGQSSFIPHAGLIPTTVPVRTLLDVVAANDLNRIDAMKIDVEGYEDRVLLPFFAAATRSLWPYRLLMEIKMQSAWQRDCVSSLLANGYENVWRGDEDALFERRD